MPRGFAQVDVFGEEPLSGNPVAVVHDADGLDDEAMQRLANWTNLSETVFLLEPTAAEADYRARIFTPTRELPFAGHPTLGACHAWLEATRDGARPERIVQECGVGLVEVRSTADGLAFASPSLSRSGPVAEETVSEIVAGLGIARDEVVEAQWVANGPPWIGVLLRSADEVLAVEPGFVDLDVGLVGFHEAGGPERIEVRAFFPLNGALVEDPVTGSLNASLGEWLVGDGRLEAPYVARQGTALGRRGRVHVTQDAAGGLWIAGATVTCVRGELG
jgi:PhzF family phenazine biosynthesis protein